MTQDIQSGRIEAGYGKAIPLDAGQRIRLINTHGSQVVDTWALCRGDSSEYLSVEHTRRVTQHLYPEVGDILYSNRRNGMLRLTEDTSPGRHDTIVACCDKWLYRHFDCPPGHRNCRDNFFEALFEAGFDAVTVPNPVNLWMNIAIRDNRTVTGEAPLSKPGDHLTFEALTDCVMVFSACPMDVTPINGEDRCPRPVDYKILSA